MAVRAPARWTAQVERDFALGMIRDSARTGIPLGGAYDIKNMLVNRPGVIYKRGGVLRGTVDITTGNAHCIALAYGNFPSIGNQLIVVGDTFTVDQVDASTLTPHGNLLGYTNIIDPPSVFFGGSTNAMVFCDSSGEVTPWFYNGAGSVQPFQGGGFTATDYDLQITGSPSGGAFKLSAQDLTSGFAYTTAAIAWNASAADVQTALEDAAPNTFACTGGALPSVDVTITVPTDWGVSYLPPEVSGVTLTGGTNPTGAILISGGISLNVPAAIHSCTHLERLLLANSKVNPSRIWWGPIVNPTTTPWDMAESWIDNDHAVTGLCSLSNQLLVFSEDGMWRIIGDEPPPDTNMSREVIGHIGCTDARSISSWGAQAIFANTHGVYATTGVGYTSLVEGRIESYWQSLFDGYDPATWAIATGVYGSRFLFVDILDDTDTLVEAFICDLSTRAWVRTGRPFAKMYASAFGSKEELYAAPVFTKFAEKCSTVFTPNAATKNDNSDNSAGITGVLLPELMMRPTGYSGILTAFGDAHLNYDLEEDGDNPVLDVAVAVGTEAASFVAVPESPLPPTAGMVKRRLTVSKDSECVTYTFSQTASSAKTEIYAVQSEIRPYGPEAEGQ